MTSITDGLFTWVSPTGKKVNVYPDGKIEILWEEKRFKNTMMYSIVLTAEEIQKISELSINSLKKKQEENNESRKL